MILCDLEFLWSLSTLCTCLCKFIIILFIQNCFRNTLPTRAPFGPPSRPQHSSRTRIVRRRIKKPCGGHLSHRPFSFLCTFVALSRNFGANAYGILGVNAATPPLSYKYRTLALALRLCHLCFDSRSCACRWELRERNIITFIGRITIFLILDARPWLITFPRRVGKLLDAFAVITVVVISQS